MGSAGTWKDPKRGLPGEEEGTRRSSSRDVRRELYWGNILFLVMTHLAGLFGLVYLVFIRFSGWTLGLGILWLALCSLATTGGYHRLFAHRTYRAARGVRFFYLLFGTAAFQGSALRWASDHRVHHALADTEKDPHNIRKGFWWAHLGWLLYKSPPNDFANVKDLRSDPLIRLQDLSYLPLGVTVGFVVPALLGWIWGDPWGGLLVGGFLRLLVEYHATFSINSFTHAFGRQPYSTASTARDSVIAALITLGEGYHNYHHRFPGDYRNGVRAHQFDPTKWWVWTLSKLGMTWGLKRAPAEAIRKAREAPSGVLPRTRIVQEGSPRAG